MKESKKENPKKIKSDNENLFYETALIGSRARMQLQRTRMQLVNMVRDLVIHLNEEISLKEIQKKKEKSERAFGKKYNDKELPLILNKLLVNGTLTRDKYDYISSLLDTLIEIKKYETKYTKYGKPLLKESIYTKFVQFIPGMGEILFPELFLKIGYCENYDTISKLWRNAGIAPRDVNGRKRGQKIHYDPGLKTLCFLIGDSFLKQRNLYRTKIYDSVKKKETERMENAVCLICGKAWNTKHHLSGKKEWDKNPDKLPDKPHEMEVPVTILENGEKMYPSKRLAQVDLRARRKMVKLFLSHYWVIARTLKGLNITEPYCVEKQKHHYIDPWEFLEEVKKYKGKKKEGKGGKVS